MNHLIRPTSPPELSSRVVQAVHQARVQRIRTVRYLWITSSTLSFLGSIAIGITVGVKLSQTGFWYYGELVFNSGFSYLAQTLSAAASALPFFLTMGLIGLCSITAICLVSLIKHLRRDREVNSFAY
jgi:hypothetical protein